MAFGEQRGYVSLSNSEVLDPLSRLREDLWTAATAGGDSGTERAQVSSLSIGNRSTQRPALVHSNVVRHNVTKLNIDKRVPNTVNKYFSNKYTKF